MAALIDTAAAQREGSSAIDARQWVNSWASAQQIVGGVNVLPEADVHDVTLRQVVHVSIGGSRVTVRFSNLFGSEPLRIDAAHIARAISSASSAVARGSDRALSFGGRPDVVIQPGTALVSDPVELEVHALSDLAISFHSPGLPTPPTGHPISSSTSYYAHGDRTADPTIMDANPVTHWYVLSGVAVDAGSRAAAVVTLGDSITDGFRSTVNGNDRWPDIFADRLQRNSPTRSIGVINAGIGGNRILQNGIGPSALSRFDRDVLAQPGARWVIILEGINDLGGLTRFHPVSPVEHQSLVHAIIDAYREMIERAHRRGLKAIGGTILPDGGATNYHPDAASDADRQAINAWIRAPGHFDDVIDFDAAVRDPRDPRRLQPRFDSGNHLHPSAAGYRAMGEAIPLAIFEQ